MIAACYCMSITMSVVSNLPPLLFLTFREQFGLSYSLLGLLILVNFSTQLAIDLVFSFFSHKFNIPKTVKLMPWIAFVGILVYVAAPLVAPRAPFAGMLLGTLIFSAASGLAEVLISPVVAALPSDNPEREMSKLHSVYAWGTVFVVIAATFILSANIISWQILVLLFSLIPLASGLLFIGADVPETKTGEKDENAFSLLKNSGVWLCVTAIFLGGAAELTMSQWASSYLEQSLGIPKVWGDVFGVAFFAAMLGFGRTLYSKKGKNIRRVLFFSAVGASACYLTAALTENAFAGLFACGFCGFCTSMLWPGSLVVASERFPQGGVVIYAMMAAGGDLGASVVPQLVGIVTDTVMTNPAVMSLGIAPEQLGMRLGLLVGAIFPIVAIPIYYKIKKTGL